MAYEKVILSKSVLVNLGDYQNEKVEMQLEYSIEPGETVEEAHAHVADRFKALLVKELEPTLERLPKWRRDMWLELLGIPKPEPEADDNPYDNDSDEPDYEDFTNPDGESDDGGSIDDFEVEDEAD